MIVSFTGRSDDLVHVYAGGVEEEFNVYEEDGLAAIIYVEADGGSAVVHAIYSRRGTWSFSLGMAKEDDDLFFVDQHAFYKAHGYCTGLNIEVPDHATISVRNRHDDELGYWTKRRGWTLLEP